MTPRYAFVTAGAQGLGRAIVRHLARQGYHLIFHYYSSQSEAEVLQAEIVQAGGEAVALQADMMQASARQALIDQIQDITPTLHVLVNNLGYFPAAKLPTLTLEQWETMLTLNCTATFHLTQLALPLLQAARPPARKRAPPLRRS